MLNEGVASACPFHLFLNLKIRYPLWKGNRTDYQKHVGLMRGGPLISDLGTFSGD